MVVLVTGNIKHIINQFFRRSRAGDSEVVSGRNLNSSKLTCMSSLPARMNQSKNEGARVVQHFSLYVYGDFQDAQWQRTPQSLV